MLAEAPSHLRVADIPQEHLHCSDFSSCCPVPSGWRNIAGALNDASRRMGDGDYSFASGRVPDSAIRQKQGAFSHSGDS